MYLNLKKPYFILEATREATGTFSESTFFSWRSLGRSCREIRVLLQKNRSTNLRFLKRKKILRETHSTHYSRQQSNWWGLNDNRFQIGKNVYLFLHLLWANAFVIPRCEICWFVRYSKKPGHLFNCPYMQLKCLTVSGCIRTQNPYAWLCPAKSPTWAPDTPTWRVPCRSCRWQGHYYSYQLLTSRNKLPRETLIVLIGFYLGCWAVNLTSYKWFPRLVVFVVIKRFSFIGYYY